MNISFPSHKRFDCKSAVFTLVHLAATAGTSVNILIIPHEVIIHCPLDFVPFAAYNIYHERFFLRWAASFKRFECLEIRTWSKFLAKATLKQCTPETMGWSKIIFGY